MADATLTAVLECVRALAGSPADDAELLERFVACREEAAFTALLDRHGPLVLGVCRQVLGNDHDAEDAFQATFLVLAKKASSIRRQEALAAWLHRVACNIARTIRTSAAWRRHVPSESRRRTGLVRLATAGVSFLHAEQPKRAVLHTGGHLESVWVNGRRVYRNSGWTGWHAGKERVPVRLRGGRNVLVIESGCDFFLSITDRAEHPQEEPRPHGAAWTR